ncbi:MAG: hypothetical protein BJ554DRAFT_193 [Olpidium bornovanus]|uniref:Uncharacterized protein n=1 Tax=Olpidium bornovanus TaxID=278681 RepID=A0A8H7ZU85_9FUNG|nr:MAG: hypothetical protein BJ554DRAFT_193 [Olpidium bornovanus]
MANETSLPPINGKKAAGVRQTQQQQRQPTGSSASLAATSKLPAIGKLDRRPAQVSDETSGGTAAAAAAECSTPLSAPQSAPKQPAAAARDAAGGGAEPGATRSARLAELYANAMTYNRARVPKQRWWSMSPSERAKYLVYEKPDPAVKSFTEEAARRVRATTRALQQQWRAEHPDGWPPIPPKVRFYEGAAQVANWQGPDAARQRLVEKERRRMQRKERELQILVDGQPNSIEAIRLMEFCAPSVKRQRPPPIPQLGENEQQRITEILENGIEC